MSSWKRIVFPLVAAVVIVVGMAAWSLPQVQAAFRGPSPASPGVTLQAQPQDQKPWIGISIVTNSSQVKDRLGLSSDQGVAITSVAADSPGANAGLQQKDIITAVDGTAVKTAQDVTKAVQAKKVGDQVTLTILRASGSQDIKVTLAAAPTRLQAPKGAPSGGLGGFLGANPGQNFQSATITIKDKDGNTRTINIVAGTITSVSDSRITVQPNGDTNTANAQSFNVTSNTKTGRGQIGNMKSGDRVLVVAEGGNALQIRDLSGAPANGSGNGAKDNNKPRGPRGPFHQSLPRGGGQQQPQSFFGGTF